MALAEREKVAAEAGKDVEAPLQLGFEGREEDVRRNWDGALEGLQRLQESVGESRRRAEGAEKVVGYMEGR